MSFSKLQSSSTMEIGTSVNNKSPFPPGYRFSPTDAELVIHYLQKKATDEPFEDPTNRFQVLELYNISLEDLIEKYREQEEPEMYVFVKKILKHRSGNRIQRGGRWLNRLQTEIRVENKLVGYRTDLVYCDQGKTRTDWLVHEYKLSESRQSDEWMLCKVYQSKRHKKIKNRANAVVKPPTVPCEKECSRPFSALLTAKQSTPIIGWESIFRPDRDDFNLSDSLSNLGGFNFLATSLPDDTIAPDDIIPRDHFPDFDDVMPLLRSSFLIPLTDWQSELSG